MSRAAALRKAFATVSCPACNHSVEAPFINAHLDSGCRKYGRRSSATKYVSGGGRSHQEDDGSHPKDSSFGREPSLKRCREVHEEDTAGVGSSAAATTKPTTVAAAEGTASQVFTIFRREAGNGSRPKTASQLAAEAEILKCIAPDLLALSRARVYPITPCAKSWVVHVPRWFSMSTDDFDALWERHPEQQATVVLFGQEVTCSRWNKMYGQDYVFSGQRSASSGPLSPGDDGCGPQLLAAFERVCTLRHNRSSAPAPPNGVLLNWYGLLQLHNAASLTVHCQYNSLLSVHDVYTSSPVFAHMHTLFCVRDFDDVFMGLDRLHQVRRWVALHRASFRRRDSASSRRAHLFCFVGSDQAVPPAAEKKDCE